MTDQICNTQKKTTLLDYFLIFAMFCIGIYVVPFQMMRVDLSFIPGNLGDARLNNYFLEHGYKWLTGQVPSFWNAPFFYPTIGTMSFSDNFLGTLPIYAIFRFMHFDRETAYQLWFFVIFTLNFFSCAWVLKKLSINALGTAVGAYVYTFSLPVIARVGHSQLLARFTIPFAIYFAWKYMESPRVKLLALTCLAVVIQFYCSIYMGFFLVLGLTSLLLAFILLHDNRFITLREFVWGSGRTIGLKAIVIFLSLISFLPLMLPYYKTSLEYGLRPWREIAQMLPRIKSYLFPAGGSLLWNWLSPMGNGLPLSWEHQIFVGALPLIAFIAMPVLYFRYRKEPLLERGMIACVTIVLLMLLTLYFGFSFYRLALFLPGLSAIRAVTRIILLMLFPFSVVLGIIIHKVSEKHVYFSRSSVKFIFFIMVLFAVILDQYVPSSNYKRYSKLESQNRSKAVEKLVQSLEQTEGYTAKIFAYMPDKSSDPPYVIQLDAMIAAQNLNIATVNGYSGSFPSNYDFYYNYDQCDSLLKWKEISTKQYSKYYYYDEFFDKLIVVGHDSCSDDRDAYTFMETELPEDGYRAKITFPSSQVVLSKNGAITLNLILMNDSPVIWRSLSSEPDSKYRIQLSYRWLSSNHSPLGGFDARIPLPYDLSPGESTSLDLTIQAPANPGEYFLEFDLVQEQVAWFHDKGFPITKSNFVVIVDENGQVTIQN